MNKKIASLKKKIADNKTAVIAATTGVAASGITALVMYKYIDRKNLIEVTTEDLQKMKYGAIGHVCFDGIEILMKMKTTD